MAINKVIAFAKFTVHYNLSNKMLQLQYSGILFGLFWHILTAETRQWHSYAPGQLLQQLQQSPIFKSLANATTTIVTPTYAGDNVVASSGDFNYERVYEDFIRKYFNSATAAVDSESSSAEEDTEMNASHQQYRKSQCKRVQRKKHEYCNICRNPKTGEKMETCMYSTESKPHEYSYRKKQAYKKSRNTNEGTVEQPTSELSDNADDDDDDDDDYEESGEVHSLKSGSCIRRRHRDQICFTCINSAGEASKKCNKLKVKKRKSRVSTTPRQTD